MLLRFNEIIHLKFLVQYLVYLAMVMRMILILLQIRKMRGWIILRGWIFMAEAESQIIFTTGDAVSIFSSWNQLFSETGSKLELQKL